MFKIQKEQNDRYKYMQSRTALEAANGRPYIHCLNMLHMGTTRETRRKECAETESGYNIQIPNPNLNSLTITH